MADSHGCLQSFKTLLGITFSIYFSASPLSQFFFNLPGSSKFIFYSTVGEEEYDFLSPSIHINYGKGPWLALLGSHHSPKRIKYVNWPVCIMCLLLQKAGKSNLLTYHQKHCYCWWGKFWEISLDLGNEKFTDARLIAERLQKQDYGGLIGIKERRP